MAPATGTALLQAVACRIVAAYMARAGYSDIRIAGLRNGGSELGVDITCSAAGRLMRVKVKPDPYFGTDPAKVYDRDLVFYRPDAGHYAFESISNNLTREPGWMFNSDADELYYYNIAIPQTEDEVAALLSEPDEVFFGELKVERDELRILPMKPTQQWFEAHYEEYTPRPVTVGDHAAWYRLIPRPDIEGAVSGIRTVGPVFRGLGG